MHAAQWAEILLLATNTVHKLAAHMVESLSIPFLHIADATAAAIRAAGFQRLGPMATAFNLEQASYTDRLRAAGVQPLVPKAVDGADTHRII